MDLETTVLLIKKIRSLLPPGMDEDRWLAEELLRVEHMRVDLHLLDSQQHQAMDEHEARLKRIESCRHKIREKCPHVWQYNPDPVDLYDGHDSYHYCRICGATKR